MTEKLPGQQKRLQICPNCGGYMRMVSDFPSEARRQNWKSESQHRSFGGKELRRFVCEKCHHREVHQVDDLEGLGEDD